MQIHELNDFTGTLGSGAYLAIDDGTDTGKISSQGLLAATEARIDNIIAGPAPSAEEIVDARLGADGVTYPSLGDAIRDQFTDVKSALTQETNARTAADNALSERITDNDTEISALQISVTNLGTHKVAQPLDEYNQPTDGTSGQSLRTKGDGTTEWADVGLPTDEQTAQAVSDWLDDHPEATTTVQDGSLTLPKFKAGEIPFVTPEQFGAKGDGITDDTDAMKEALESSLPVLLISGKSYYLTDDVTITKDFFGYGEIITDHTVYITSSLDHSEDNSEIILRGKRTNRDWANDDAPLFNFITRNVCRNITILHCEDAYIGIKIEGQFAHNVVTITNTINCLYHLYFDNTTDYENENLFIGGRFSNFDLTDAEAAMSAYGIYMHDAGGNRFNGNYFLKPCFQLGSNGTGIYAENAVMNTFVGCRCEPASLKLCEFSSSCYSNLVEPGYNDTTLIFTDNGLNHILNNRERVSWQANYQISGYNDKLIYMKASDRLSLKNMVSKDVYSSGTSAKYALASNGIIDSNVGIGFKFAKSEATVFNIRTSTDDLLPFVSFHKADGTEASVTLTYPDIGTSRWGKQGTAYRGTGYTKNSSFRVIGDYAYMIIGYVCDGTKNPENIIVSADAPTQQLEEREYYEQLYQNSLSPEEGDLIMHYGNSKLRLYAKLDSRIGYAEFTVQE